MNPAALFALGTAVLAFGLFSRKLERRSLTPPMAFTLVGLVCGAGVFGLRAFEADRELIHLLAELTLVLVLFTDASRIDLRVLTRERGLPLRLLLVGLPLTIVLGSVVGHVLGIGGSVWVAALIAAVLAPTDAALGMAVVSDERVPLRIRQALNVESGLNDGIALPVVLVLLSVADVMGGSGAQRADYWLQFIALQVTLGPLVGLAVGGFLGKLVQRAWERDLVEPVFLRLSSIALAILAFGLAELLHGNGFIAAFVAGLSLGNFTVNICEPIHRFGETEGQLMTLLTFLVFGAIMVPSAFALVGGTSAVYAVLSLTLVRMLPVALCVVGTGLRLSSVLFLGWFGPRGIASILFALVVLEGSATITDEHMAVVTLTVFMSVMAHGVTASPFARWYALSCDRLRQREDLPENQSVTPMRVRIQPVPRGA